MLFFSMSNADGMRGKVLCQFKIHFDRENEDLLGKDWKRQCTKYEIERRAIQSADGIDRRNHCLPWFSPPINEVKQAFFAWPRTLLATRDFSSPNTDVSCTALSISFTVYLIQNTRWQAMPSLSLPSSPRPTYWATRSSTSVTFDCPAWWCRNRDERENEVESSGWSHRYVFIARDGRYRFLEKNRRRSCSSHSSPLHLEKRTRMDRRLKRRRLPYSGFGRRREEMRMFVTGAHLFNRLNKSKISCRE